MIYVIEIVKQFRLFSYVMNSYVSNEQAHVGEIRLSRAFKTTLR